MLGTAKPKEHASIRQNCVVETALVSERVRLDWRVLGAEPRPLKIQHVRRLSLENLK